MSESDRIRLQHMLDAATEALSFVATRAKEDLGTNRQLALALIKEIEIVGEAASRISPEMKERYPDVPWGAIVGMRNRLIHSYADIDLDVLWSAVTLDLPQLLLSIHRMMQ